MATSKSKYAVALPMYGKLWRQLKDFPRFLSQGAQTPPSVSGPAAAALVSAAFSCFLLMVNQHLTVVFKAWDQVVWMLGSWIPGSRNPDPLYGEIGSYSGKETMMLVGWLLSWLVLSRLWQHRQVQARTMFFWIIAFVVAATVMNWHPIFPYLPLAPK